MMGRIDVSGRPCSHCKATGKDPRKRTRQCPQCGGSKVEVYCETCGEMIWWDNEPHPHCLPWCDTKEEEE